MPLWQQEELRPGEQRVVRRDARLIRGQNVRPVVELDEVGHMFADLDPRAVALPFPLVAALELDFRAGMLALRVRGQKIVQPPRNLVIAPA